MKWSKKDNEICVEAYFNNIEFIQKMNSKNEKLMMIFIENNVEDFNCRTRNSWKLKLGNIESAFRKLTGLPPGGLWGSANNVMKFVEDYYPKTVFFNKDISMFGDVWFNAQTNKPLKELKELVDSKVTQYKNISLIDKLKDEDEYILSKARSSKSQRIWKNALIEIRGKTAKCDILNCEIKNIKLLFASHIKPYSKSEPSEKFDINNGLLLCPNHDRLFDQGYLSFTPSGDLIIGDNVLTEKDYISFGINAESNINIETQKKSEYLKYHFENVYKK